MSVTHLFFVLVRLGLCWVSGLFGGLATWLMYSGWRDLRHHVASWSWINRLCFHVLCGSCVVLGACFSFWLVTDLWLGGWMSAAADLLLIVFALAIACHRLRFPDPLVDEISTIAGDSLP